MAVPDWTRDHLDKVTQRHRNVCTSGPLPRHSSVWCTLPQKAACFGASLHCTWPFFSFLNLPTKFSNLFTHYLFDILNVLLLGLADCLSPHQTVSPMKTRLIICLAPLVAQGKCLEKLLGLRGS